MVQFYLLSVILNIGSGYALVSIATEPKGGSFDGVRQFLKDPPIRLAVGLLAFFVGFFKMINVMRGDIPVVGDLFPSVAGMASGFTMLLEYYRANAKFIGPVLEKLDGIFVANRRIVGIGAFASGVVHFLFANVIFL